LNSALTAGIHNISNTSLTLLSKEASAVSHTTTKAANACQQYTLKVLSCRNSFNISVWLGIKILDSKSIHFGQKVKHTIASSL
jgi:hypothetical protein